MTTTVIRPATKYFASSPVESPRYLMPTIFLTATVGEEFAVVMCENDLQDALVLANQIRAVIAETPFSTHKAPIDITVSFGISGVTGLDKIAPTPLDLIEEADQMLYRAKGNGRNRVEL
jgi:diguanylate cyclase (GGDEF)-like protein